MSRVAALCSNIIVYSHEIITGKHAYIQKKAILFIFYQACR